MRLRPLSIAALFVVLFFPYLILVFETRTLVLPGGEAMSAFAFTFTQAFASALMAMIIGLIGAFALNFTEQRYGIRIERAAIVLALLPNAAPVLILLMGVMKTMPWARGFLGIILVHCLLNCGLVAVSLVALFKRKIGGMAELAWIEGCSRIRFLHQVVVPYLITDFTTIALFVFAICFASFAVPLMLGGSRATTIETLIYQKIRIAGAWDQAVTLALLQALAIAFFSWLLRGRKSSVVSSRVGNLPLLSHPFGFLFLLFPAALMLAGLVGGAKTGWAQFLIIDPRPLIAGSLFTALATGVISVCLLAWIAYLHPEGAVRKALLGYASPSAVLTGFAILFVWRTTGVATYFKIAVGLSLAAIPGFYRLYWDSLLRGLDGQRTVARTMGASSAMIFRQIVWPQVVGPAFRIAGLAAVWAWGDFGLSSVVAERTVTLALLTQSLMASYRFDAATIAIWFVIAGALITYIFFDGVGRVLGAKSQT